MPKYLIDGDQLTSVSLILTFGQLRGDLLVNRIELVLLSFMVIFHLSNQGCANFNCFCKMRMAEVCVLLVA